MSYDSGSNYKYPKQKEEEQFMKDVNKKLSPNQPSKKQEPDITLENLPVGRLFKHGKTIALKTEYRTESGAIEAFIVGSGEMFWGGTNTADQQGKLLVTPISL